MNWQCRLYGHQWRHPGRYEVILGRDGPKYPFQCSVCRASMVLDREGSQLTGADSGVEQFEFGTRVDPESAAEPSVTE